MTRKSNPALFLAAVALIWGAFAFPQYLAGVTLDAPAQARDFDGSGPVFETASEESPDMDDPAQEVTVALDALSFAESDHPKPPEHFKTALAIEPDAPVPLSGLTKACLSKGADAPGAPEVARVRIS